MADSRRSAKEEETVPKVLDTSGRDNSGEGIGLDLHRDILNRLHFGKLSELTFGGVSSLHDE